MRDQERPHVVAVRAPDFRMNALTRSAQDARALAEALYEARPRWRISVDGNDAVFSREGKIVGWVDDAPGRRTGTRW